MGVLGIDCGKFGALAYHTPEQTTFWPMPLKDGEIDLVELHKITFMLPLEVIIISFFENNKANFLCVDCLNNIIFNNT